MLEINKEYNASLNAFDSQLFQDLTADEASGFTGGLSLTNDTNRNLSFYTLGPNSNPQRQSLASGATGTYNTKYILHDALLGDPYEPVVKALDNSGDYRFTSVGTRISIVGITQNLDAP